MGCSSHVPGTCVNGRQAEQAGMVSIVRLMDLWADVHCELQQLPKCLAPVEWRMSTEGRYGQYRKIDKSMSRGAPSAVAAIHVPSTSMSSRQAEQAGTVSIIRLMGQ